MPGPDVWGPHGWKFIHYITLGYPNNPTEKDKNNYYNFFMNLANVIPCGVCANHFKENLQITPLDDNALKDKESLMIWGITMHNHVNARNGKKIYSIKEAIKAIIEDDDTCLILKEDKNLAPLYKTKHVIKENLNNNSSTTILSISIIINILLILLIVLKLK
jgi:hypothetical protein